MRATVALSIVAALAFSQTAFAGKHSATMTSPAPAVTSFVGVFSGLEEGAIRVRDGVRQANAFGHWVNAD